MFLAECLDLDIYTSRQVELHQGVDGLLRRLENIEQTFMRTNFKLLARLLVHVGRTQYAVLVLHRGQRNRACDLRAGAFRSFDNLTRGLIQDAIVVSLQPNANSFFSNHVWLSLTPPGCPGRKNYVARAPSPAILRSLRSSGQPRAAVPTLLRHDLADGSGAYCVAAFANGEA